MASSGTTLARGSSWGGMLAMQYVLDRQPDLVYHTGLLAGEWSPAGRPAGR